jgi:hypothetical protein
MGMVLVALAWPAVALILVFMIIPAVWESLFGPAHAAYAAIASLVLVVWGSVKMTNWSDRLNGMAESRRAASAPVAVEPDVTANWQEYNAAIARNKRWAFYRRTHQYDRLRELEQETKEAAVQKR